MEKETECKFKEVLAHIGYAFGETPEAIGRALQKVGTFDNVVMLCLSKVEMGISLDKALKQMDDSSSPYHCTCNEIHRLWEQGMTYYVH